MPKSRGFTLIELLITISIIAILSAIGFIVYSAALKQGRDSRRQSDLRLVQSALEQYYNDQGFYPYSSSLTKGAAFTNATGNVTGTAVTKTYLNSVPGDPNGSSYAYAGYTSTTYLDNTCDNSTSAKYCGAYCLYTQLENSSATVLNGCPANGTYNFAVTLP